MRGVPHLLALALTASAAGAQQTEPAAAPVSFDGLGNAPAVYAFPGDDTSAPPFRLSLEQVDDGAHIATLRIHNTLTTWEPDGPHPLRVGDLVIVAEVRMGMMSEPDTIVVSTPPGYVAEPTFVVVPEGGDAEIRIIWPMG